MTCGPFTGRSSHKKLNLVKNRLGIFISKDMLFYSVIVKKEVKAADRRMDGKKEYQEERLLGVWIFRWES